MLAQSVLLNRSCMSPVEAPGARLPPVKPTSRYASAPFLGVARLTTCSVMLPQPIIVSILGAAAVVCFVLGLWLPLVDAERRIARRLQGFVQAPIAASDTHLVLARPRGQILS